MEAVLEVESTLTDRYQTTVPETVRRALQLQKRDKIHYKIQPSGEVLLARSDSAAGVDPALESFLSFLSKNITNQPEQIKAIDADLALRIQNLTKGVSIDLDAALLAADE